MNFQKGGKETRLIYSIPLEIHVSKYHIKLFTKSEVVNRGMEAGSPTILAIGIGAILLRDISSYDKILLHLIFQTCFVIPGLINVMQSFQKNSIKIELIRTRDV